CFTLSRLVIGAQQVGWMVGDHHRDVIPFEPAAAHAGDPFLAAGEVFGGGGAERADRFGADGLELTAQKLAATLQLVRLGRAGGCDGSRRYTPGCGIAARRRRALRSRRRTARPGDRECECPGPRNIPGSGAAVQLASAAYRARRNFKTWSKIRSAISRLEARA